MKVVYVAGKFTAPTTWECEQNIRRAEEAGYQVAKLGASPLIPHSNTRFFVGTFTPEFWYEATLALLLKADAVLMIGDWRSSKGARTEHAAAEAARIPIFSSIDALDRWLGGLL